MRPWIIRELVIGVLFGVFVAIGVATVLIPGLRTAPDPAPEALERPATKTQ